jgi:multidrug efflux pump subunit AcrB
VTGASLKNPIAVLMACIALVVFGAVVTPRLSIDTFPELSPPVLVIGTQVSGMGPRDVEKTITWRLEKFVSATPGVDHVQSVSRQGLSVIFVWLKWGTDLGKAQLLVQQQVDFAMSSIPKSLGVVPPFVLQYDPTNAPVIQIAVRGGGLSGPQLYDFAQNAIAPKLEGIQGVASASPNGGRERQINVVVDPTRATARGVTSAEVAAAVSQANALLPSGRFMGDGFDANVYTNAVPAKVEQIGEALVKVVGGRPVYVRDVADVVDGGTRAAQYVSIDAEPAVYLNVLRVPGGNVLRIVEEVKRTLAELSDLPPGVKVEPIFDQSTFVRTSFHGLQREILQALLLVAAVILLFLQSPRAVLIACFSVPISFGVILIVLYATGQTLNAFTLGGLTLSMGPLVDISVVVLEAIHRERALGKSPVRAALDGTRSVSVPALSAMLSTLAVLMPIVLLDGLAKRLFVPLGLTVATAMIVGYVVSMTVTPTACRYLLGHSHGNRLQRLVEGAIVRLSLGYARALEAVLPHRLVLLGSVGALVVGTVVAARGLPSTFFPEIDESMERVYVRFAPGTSLEAASRQLDDMARMLKRELPEGTAELVLVNVGKPGKARSAMNSPNHGPHMGFLRVALPPPEKRTMTQREVADRMRALLGQRYPGVDFLQWPGGLVASVFSNGYIAPLVVELRGEDLEQLSADARRVADVARTVAGVRDVYVSVDDYPEIMVETDRLTAGQVGVTARAAAQTTLEATLGNINTPGIWVDGQNGQSYYVVTFYDGDEVRDVPALRDVPVRATPEAAIPLGAYGTVERRFGPIAIDRNQLTRTALVYMQTEGRDVGSAAAELEERLAAEPATAALAPRFVGQVELMRSTFGGLGVAVGLAIMIVTMVMAVQFRSLRLPLVMLLALPASLIGIVAALLLAGQGFSVTALMGSLMVIGIAVSNGILLVDHAATRYREGLSAIEAVLDAGKRRLVPILMTSLATVLGLLPAALGLEHGTEGNRPLALAVVGGLTTSTLLSLFVVPALFTMLVGPRPAPEAEEGALEAA